MRQFLKNFFKRFKSNWETIYTIKGKATLGSAFINPFEANCVVKIQVDNIRNKCRALVTTGFAEDTMSVQTVADMYPEIKDYLRQFGIKVS